MHNLGHTRSTYQRDHLLHTPDSFVRTALPGMQEAVGDRARLAPLPARGLRSTPPSWSQAGSLGTAAAQRFVYVLEGSCRSCDRTSFRTLTAGSYAYFPAGHEHTFTAREKTRLAVIEKNVPRIGFDERLRHHSSDRRADVAPVPLMGDPDLEVRSLVAGFAGLRLRREHDDLISRARHSAWWRCM